MEHELLELWSAVEKDKEAMRERATAARVARAAQRAQMAAPKQVGAADLTHLALERFQPHMQMPNRRCTSAGASLQQLGLQHTLQQQSTSARGTLVRPLNICQPVSRQCALPAGPSREVRQPVRGGEYASVQPVGLRAPVRHLHCNAGS